MCATKTGNMLLYFLLEIGIKDLVLHKILALWDPKLILNTGVATPVALHWAESATFWRFAFFIASAILSTFLKVIDCHSFYPHVHIFLCIEDFVIVIIFSSVMVFTMPLANHIVYALLTSLPPRPTSCRKRQTWELPNELEVTHLEFELLPKGDCWKQAFRLTVIVFKRL